MTADELDTTGWTIEEWRNGYRDGKISLKALVALSEKCRPEDPAWLRIASRQELERALDELERRAGTNPAALPLYGIPFAVKDNIDIAGWPTTAACPEYAYLAVNNATVVERICQAGGIVLGKTNLDQFATGLVGTRSPYGVVPSTFDETRIGGGSSSGSASVVARGLVPFSLGTDTAGSGRVPAAFNNIVGLKPTRGRLSTSGVVPACRSLDCVSLFSLTVEDAAELLGLVEGFDRSDPYSREKPGETASFSADSARLAVPQDPEFFGDALACRAFEKALSSLEALGATLTPIDFGPFAELAKLLYQGPWVAERTVVIEKLLAEDPNAVHPVVRKIIEGGFHFSAMQTFSAEYRRAELARDIALALEPFDALVVPTTPTSYTLAEVLDDPFTTNSRLGTFTNFANLADLSALAVPSAYREDGFPAGITLIAPAFRDEVLTTLGIAWQQALQLPLGSTGRDFRRGTSKTRPVPAAPRVIELAVVGAHLSGLPLNGELTRLGATFAEATSTAPFYRLYALPNTIPPKPGLLRVASGGTRIALEVWRVPTARFGEFVSAIPAPLGIGKLSLSSGREVHGFLCEACAVEGALDISHFGGFRAYLAAQTTTETKDHRS